MLDVMPAVSPPALARGDVGTNVRRWHMRIPQDKTGGAQRLQVVRRGGAGRHRLTGLDARGAAATKVPDPRTPTI